MTTELETAQNARQLAENKLATLRASAEAIAMERTVKLLESPQPVVVPWTDYPGFDQSNHWPVAFNRPYYWSSVDDRTEGRYRPLYETEQDLRVMRADARTFHAKFPIAAGLVESLTNYVIGTGWDFTVKPKPDYENDPGAVEAAAVVQRVLDRFLERNEFIGSLDREIEAESRIVGEAFPTIYPDGRDARIELVDADCILQPASPAPLERHLKCNPRIPSFWWHGVHTLYSPILKRDDVTRPCGYHAVFDREGRSWDYLPAHRVEHIKRNVGRTARRGVGDFVIIAKDLRDEAKIRHNTAEGAAILAAIVMIRQHAEGVNQAGVENFVAANSTHSYQRVTPDRSFTQSNEQVAPGTVKDIPFGMTSTLGPMGTLRSPVYIEVAQYLNRIMGTSKQSPEYLISGDASNEAFASALMSEGPFIKGREHDQAFSAARFVSLIWKGLLFYSEHGWFPGLTWQYIRQALNIEAEYTSPATRDKAEQATVNKTLHDSGIMSKRTWAADSGLDLDEEIANGAAEKAPEPSPFGGMLQGQSMQPPYVSESNKSAIPPRILELAEKCFKE